MTTVSRKSNGSRLLKPATRTRLKNPLRKRTHARHQAIIDVNTLDSKQRVTARDRQSLETAKNNEIDCSNPEEQDPGPSSSLQAKNHVAPPGRCRSCNPADTRRRRPDGPGTLCNACGLRIFIIVVTRFLLLPHDVWIVRKLLENWPTSSWLALPNSRPPGLRPEDFDLLDPSNVPMPNDHNLKNYARNQYTTTR